MATLLGTLLDHARRKWRSRLAADAPSWTAGVIIRSTSAAAPDDEDRHADRDNEWQCARAPALIRMFQRTRRPRGRTSTRSLLCAAALMIASGCAVGDANAATVSVRATEDQLKLACTRARGEFFSSASGYGCITYNCDGKNGHCSVTCDSDGLCTGAMPPTPVQRAR
jgi:hypothetical protein